MAKKKETKDEKETLAKKGAWFFEEVYSKFRISHILKINKAMKNNAEMAIEVIPKIKPALADLVFIFLRWIDEKIIEKIPSNGPIIGP